MSAVARELIAAVQSSGGNVTLVGGKLKVEAPTPLPTDVVARLREAKGEVLAVLIAAAIPVTSEAHFIPRYIDATHRPTDPNRCNLCGGGDAGGAALVPFGGKTAGHVWLHPACWAEWAQGQQERGKAAHALRLKNVEDEEYAP